MPSALRKHGPQACWEPGIIFPKAPRALLGDAELMLSWVGALSSSWECVPAVPRGSNHPKPAGAACMCLLRHVSVCVCDFLWLCAGRVGLAA